MQKGWYISLVVVIQNDFTIKAKLNSLKKLKKWKLVDALELFNVPNRDSQAIYEV